MTTTSQSVIKTGGHFDSDNKHLYFIASNVGRMQYGQAHHDYLLIAINELNTKDELAHLYKWISNGRHVFIDSGVYNLTMEHARKYDVSMDVALSIPPEEIYGFDNLFDKYVEIVTPIKDDCWGYIEIDAGGRENKIKTRARLEALGLNPIPVYHPLNDGWDYFDYLAERYDRICFGNVVQAENKLREKLMATLWMRRQKYPDLWVHLLGMTPSPLLVSYPMNSCDSSSWLSSMRWEGQSEYALCKTLGKLLENYQYQLGSESDADHGSKKAASLSALASNFLQQNWSAYLDRLEEIGISIC